MAKVLITGIKSYSFKNDNGEDFSGSKISYLSSRCSVKDGECGFIPMQVTVKPNLVSRDIKDVPGIYNLDFDMVSGKNNKPELQITGFDFISTFDMSTVFDF